MNRANQGLIAGILIVLTVFAALGVVLASTNAEEFMAERREYHAAFGPGADVQGLNEKSAVRILGVDVGAVEDVAVEVGQDGDPKVRVVFTLPEHFLLRRGTRLSVQSSLTGESRINIESLGNGEPLAQGESVQGYTLTLGDVLAHANDIAPKAAGTLEEMERLVVHSQALLVENRAKIDQTFTNVHRASADVKGGIAEIRRAPWRLIHRPNNRDQRSLDIYEAARQFAHGAHDLHATALSIEVAAEHTDGDPAKMTELRDELAEQIATFAEFREALWDQLQP